MNFNLAVIGFGVIGSETIDAIHKKLKNSPNKKKFKIAIIERNFHNVPGGVAYSVNNSKYGFFNNPLRLSHPDFIKWINIKKNRKILISFINDNPDYNLKNWLSSNRSNLNRRRVNNETYFPRLVYSFYLKEKILICIEKSIRNKISINFYKGNINKIIPNKNNILISEKNLIEFKLKKKSKDLKFSKKKLHTNKITSKNIIVGNGLTPPRIIPIHEYKKNTNYIWDFYTNGGVGNLKKKINYLLKNKSNLKVAFIGNKAGLLENLIELRELILIKKKSINLFSISNSPNSLEKAELSKNFKKYKFTYFTNVKIRKIIKADKILKFLILEFSKAKQKNFSRYDVWTKILSNKLLNKCYNNLSEKEKNIYNNIIFPKIRNLTRYTFPETVNAMKELKASKKLKNINGSVKKIIKKSNCIYVETNSGLVIKTDILVNVSGPAKIDCVNKEDNLILSLKNISRSYDTTGFNVNRNFLFKNSIFLPGVISNSFNPYRQTIIKAITNNVKKVCKNIIKEYKKNHG